MPQIGCPSCGGKQEVPPEATLYVCKKCQSEVTFVVCPKCSITIAVLPEWKAVVCPNCGKTSAISRTADKLQRIGQNMESAGRSIQSFVGALFTLGLIWFFWQCTEAT